MNSWETFLQNGLPGRKNERWKYTDLSFLTNRQFSNPTRVDADNLLDGVQQNRLQRCDSVMLVLVNGYFMPLLSDLNKLPEGVIACSMRDSAHQHLDLIKTHLKENIDADLYPFASLNASQLTDGLFLYLPDDMDMPLPVHLVSIVTGTEEFLAHPRHIFILGKNSKLVFLEEHYSHTDLSYMMNIVTSLVVEENAKLEYYKLQCEGKNAVHMAHTFIRQKQNSSVSFTDFATGGTFARDEIVVKLRSPAPNAAPADFIVCMTITNILIIILILIIWRRAVTVKCCTKAFSKKNRALFLMADCMWKKMRKKFLRIRLIIICCYPITRKFIPSLNWKYMRMM